MFLRTSRRRTAAALGAAAVFAVGTAGVRTAWAPAATTSKAVYIPSSWKSTGQVPWSSDRSQESANFVLLWGEKSGTDPASAPGDYEFDPDDVLGQLEKAYAYYRDTMEFTPETGAMAQYKVIVIVTRTWNRTALDAWANGGSADGKVGVINLAPAAAAPGSWSLAHELAHVFQNFTFLGRGSGTGFTDASAGTFWETSAEYMTMQYYPGKGAGDLTRFLRTENLAFSSSRHHYGNWMLVQYLVDKHGGLKIFTDLWNRARATEHPLETYRRITGTTQDRLNTTIGEYAQHQVTYDYGNRDTFLPLIENMYGAGFVTAYNGVPVEAVDKATGHYAIPDATAPSDYGYNKIKLVPSSDGALIRLHFKGHVDSAARSGWSYGFVAVRNGTARYGKVSTAADGQISFQTQPGEKEVYLVVAGTPQAVHHYAFLDGYTKNHRYPYEFRIDGAVPSGHESGYTKPAATGGGHWHSNGGGWVSDSAEVASTAYVGPRAAVYGSATVSGRARIEGLAWVNSGGTVGGSAVVKDNAIVQGGVTISGNAVVGGDAEPSGTCSSGTYLLFDPDRGCDGASGEKDVNPSYTRFTDAELAITSTGSASPAPTATPTASPAPKPSAAPTAAPTGWKVTWTYPDGQRITGAQGAAVTSSGAKATARPYGGGRTLAPGSCTTFTLRGTWSRRNTSPAPTRSPA